SEVEEIATKKSKNCTEMAIKLFKIVLQSNPNDYESNQSLGDIYSRLSKKEKGTYASLSNNYLMIASELNKKNNDTDCLFNKLESFSKLSLSNQYLEKIVIIEDFDNAVKELEEKLSELSSSIEK